MTVVQNPKGSGDDFIWQLIEATEVADTSSKDSSETKDSSKTGISLVRKVESLPLLKAGRFDAMGRKLAPARRTPRNIRLY